MKKWFADFAEKSSEAIGSAYAFFIAVVLVIIWLGSGPFFHWSDTWQLIINTATTISTGLIVFLIQNTQNRWARRMIALEEQVARDSPHVDDREADRRAEDP